jgi:hypothetical protein
MADSSADSFIERRWAWRSLLDLNPVLAKEVVVTARTPLYKGSIVVALLFLGVLIFAGFGASRRMTIHGWAVDGVHLFPYFFTGLALILATFGASLGSTVLVQERQGGGLDALKFSSLAPRTIAVGKFAAVMLAEAAVVLCASPLLMFVLSLGGVSLGQAAIGTTIAITAGAMAAALGIGVSAHAPNPSRSLLFSLLGTSAVGILVTIWLALGSDLAHLDNPMGVVYAYASAWTPRHTTLLIALPAFGVTTVLSFGYAITTSGLMDGSEDRSRPLKIWMWTVLAAGGAALLVGERSREDATIVATLVMIASGLLAIVLLLLFAGEPLSLTRRMRAHPAPSFLALLSPRRIAPSMLSTIVWTGAAMGMAVMVLPSTLPCALWAFGNLAAIGGVTGAAAARGGPTRGRIAGAVVLLVPLLFVALFHDIERGSWVDTLCPLWVLGRGGLWLSSVCMPGAAVCEWEETRRAIDHGVLRESVWLWGSVALLSCGAMLLAAKQRKAVGST